MVGSLFFQIWSNQLEKALSIVLLCNQSGARNSVSFLRTMCNKLMSIIDKITKETC